MTAGERQMTNKSRRKRATQQIQSPDTKVEFIVSIYDDVMTVSRQSGFSWLFMLAQSAEETGWGSGVKKGSNNIFNIKADKSWTGKTVTVKQARENRINADNKLEIYFKESKFRAYGSYTESIHDWLKFLEGQDRYHGKGRRDDNKPFINIFDPEIKSDLEKLAFALEHDGYATDMEGIGYARKIINTARCPTMRRALAEVEKRKLRETTARAAFGAVPQRNNDPASIRDRWWVWDSNNFDDSLADRWKNLP
jgi:flagellum-specific peptidoglycan hydrolase FlgJ